MLTNVFLAITGLVMLFFGGDSLIRGASALASHIGVPPLAIGLTVVAFGTSAPELVVSLDAAISGANDIAVGNVVGSNIANIALILGIAAVLRPLNVEAKLVRVDSPIMILVSVGLIGVLIDGSASRIEGFLLLVGLAAYTAFTFWEARRESEKVQEEFASAAPGAGAGGIVSLVRVAIGLALLILGGHVLVTAAVELANLFGVSQAVIGLTIVAVGTSLPELTTSLMASIRGQGDIAIGNVIGSNIFNILGILGLTAVVSPLQMGAITWVDLSVMLLLACVLTLFLFTRLRLQRIEGAFLVVGFMVYVGWLLAV